MTPHSFGIATEEALRIERVDAAAALGAADRRQIAELFAACFPCCREEEDPARADWRWVIRLGERIVCHAGIRRQAAAGRHHRLGHLAYFATAPACRGRGLGTRLLREVQADAPALGLGVVVLHAEREAVPLYRRAGWIEIARGAYYRAERRYSDDPVLAWSPDPTEAEALRRAEFYHFPRDW